MNTETLMVIDSLLSIGKALMATLVIVLVGLWAAKKMGLID